MNHYEVCGRCHSRFCICKESPTSRLIGQVADVAKSLPVDEEADKRVDDLFNHQTKPTPVEKGSVFVGGMEELHQLVLADLDDICGDRDRLEAELNDVRTACDHHVEAVNKLEAQVLKYGRELDVAREALSVVNREASGRDNEIRKLSRRIGVLYNALMDVQHGVGHDGPCWCMYFLAVHSTPGDMLKTHNGHTDECWRARLATRGDPDDTGRDK